MRFEWDEAKAQSNERKHGVRFEEARTVFADELALVYDDPDHSDAEDRFLIVGYSTRSRLLVVVHCYRASAEVIRIISARPATRAEQRVHQEQRSR